MLAEHPKRIAAATTRTGAHRLRTERILGEWTAVDILAHLRACADARGDVIPLILDGQHSTLRAVNPQTLIDETGYRDLDFATSFRAFARQRAGLVMLLRSIPRNAWSRTALFTGFGTPRERSVLFYAQWVARHERAHVRHLEIAFAGGAVAGTRPQRGGVSRPGRGRPGGARAATR